MGLALGRGLSARAWTRASCEDCVNVLETGELTCSLAPISQSDLRSRAFVAELDKRLLYHLATSRRQEVTSLAANLYLDIGSGSLDSISLSARPLWTR